MDEKTKSSTISLFSCNKGVMKLIEECFNFKHFQKGVPVLFGDVSLRLEVSLLAVGRCFVSEDGSIYFSRGCKNGEIS